MKAILDFFTPEKRKAIYIIVAAGAAALTAFGIVTQDQLDQVVQNVSGIIALLTALLAAFNVNPE